MSLLLCTSFSGCDFVLEVFCIWRKTPSMFGPCCHFPCVIQLFIKNLGNKLQQCTQRLAHGPEHSLKWRGCHSPCMAQESTFSHTRVDRSWPDTSIPIVQVFGGDAWTIAQVQYRAGATVQQNRTLGRRTRSTQFRGCHIRRRSRRW